MVTMFFLEHEPSLISQKSILTFATQRVLSEKYKVTCLMTISGKKRITVSFTCFYDSLKEPSKCNMFMEPAESQGARIC